MINIMCEISNNKKYNYERHGMKNEKTIKVPTRVLQKTKKQKNKKKNCHEKQFHQGTMFH